MERWAMAGVVLAAMIMGGGCGDGDDGSLPPGVSSGDDISKLSQEDAVALCEHYTAQTDSLEMELENSLCSARALGISMVVDASCEELRDECLAEEVMDDGVDEGDCSDAEVPDCPGVTVGEFDRCIQAQTRQARDVLGSINCNSSLEDLQALDEGAPEQPPECDAVEEKCPSLFEDESASVGMGG